MVDLASVNIFAVILAAIVSFVVGAVWYTALFGKVWQKEVGLSDKEIESGNMALTYGGSFVAMLIMSFGMAVYFAGVDQELLNLGYGAVSGFVTGVFFVATSVAINYLYQRKSLRLWLIDAGYQVLFLTIIGVILAVWR